MSLQETKPLFLHNFRTAGNFIKRRYKGQINTVKDFPTNSGHPHLNDYYKFYGRSFFKNRLFTVVRNPWDRMASLYRHFVNNNLLDKFDVSDFDKFIEFIHRGPGKFRYFKRSSSSYVFWRDQQISKYIRFENLAEGLSDLESEYNLTPAPGRVTLPNNPHYSTYYNTDKSIELVRESCSDDCENFGYTFEQAV